MKKCILISILIIHLLSLSACTSAETIKPAPTPENPYLEEELAAQAIATGSAKRTQSVPADLPYVEISNGKQKYLAFWFIWNDETVFLPIAESTMADSGLLSCQLDSEREIAIGKLFSGWEILQGECVVDEKAPENALPIIRIPGYFDDGIKIDHNNKLDAGDWNIIDLNGEYAGNFAEVVTLIIENDFFGSGDLIISLHRMDGPNGNLYESADTVPTYTLPVEMLQITFSSGQLANFEYVDDVVYALEREFTWNILAGTEELNLSPGDENWFVLKIEENGMPLSAAYIQIKGVGALTPPDN